MIDLYSYFDKIYYINLEEDKNKKVYFEQEIQKSKFLSKTCKRYEAVIGKYLDIRLIPESIVTTKAKNDIIKQKQRQYGVSLTYGSLACALSHNLIYKECKDAFKPFLVLEDDIIITERFDQDLSTVIQEVEGTGDPYDIVYLGCNEIPGFQKKIINNIISKPRGLITGTYGYYVSQSGAKKLLDIVFPLYKQIDSCISDNVDKFDLFCSTTKIVNVRTDFVSRTQMDTSCKNIHTIPEEYSDWHKLFI
jgi:GR25 family glycosyltransferase involved in LPS biosynthesis